MRYVYVAYGDVSKVQLKASAKPLDALLCTGCDLFLEIGPKRWVRAVDLPEGHPALVNLSAGALKAGLIDANGQTFTILNAYNPEHRRLAAREGLFINVPFNEDKLKELLKTLENIRESLQVLTESRLLDLQNRIDKIKERLGILKDLKAVESQIEAKEKAQAVWDSAVNDAAHLLDKIVALSSELFPSRYEQWALRQAIEKAKKEAAFEEAIEESVLLNPQRLKELRQKLLEE